VKTAGTQAAVIRTAITPDALHGSDEPSGSGPVALVASREEGQAVRAPVLTEEKAKPPSPQYLPKTRRAAERETRRL
jgi:hypothetical protein